jgi:hypothetical protein
VLGDPGQYVDEPGLRVDVVHFGGDDQAVDRCGALPTPVGTREQPQFSAEGNTS